jgi:glycosyltransferase involved in cell wall biosynthesis
MPSICIIHEAISKDSAISKVALVHVRTALEAGWNVSVVAKYLDPSLHDSVEWLRLTVPRRSFFLKWITARHFIRQAMGNRQFDVIQAHQPQVADISDVFSCHFLTRVAYERKCLETRAGLRPKFIRLQQQGVLYAEDRCYRRFNPQTHILFCSDLIRDEFARLYGLPPSQDVLILHAPPPHDLSDETRRAARAKLVGDFPGLVIGYLGGLHERKGYKRLIPAIANDPGLFLLMAGANCQGYSPPELAGRIRGLGLVDDVSTFYAACDCIAVPSLFEPLGLVALEAAAHGVPVIATEEVGVLPALLQFGAGAKWSPSQPLGTVARALLSDLPAVRRNARHMVDELSEQRHGQRMLEVWDRVLHRRSYDAKSAAVTAPRM